jgi:hypothetical protein
MPPRRAEFDGRRSVAARGREERIENHFGFGLAWAFVVMAENA